MSGTCGLVGAEGGGETKCEAVTSNLFCLQVVDGEGQREHNDGKEGIKSAQYMSTTVKH